ncbi:MAG: hypothetical protein KAR39_05295 [Thermoplasmata archaeon]|nr:hypothetical protein [Thermoplasmata archaeon]
MAYLTLLTQETRAENFSANVAVWPNQFLDQIGPSIEVDAWGRIYIAWAEFNNSATTREILVARSDNGGSSFQSPVKVSDNISWAELPKISVSRDGEVHVVWVDWRNDADGKWMPGGGIDGVDDTDIYYANSTDGGKTFSPNLRVNDDNGTAFQFLSPNGGSVDVDESDIIHIVWADLRNGTNSVYYSRSTDGGISFEANRKIPSTAETTLAPTVSTDVNGYVYVAWEDDRNITTRPDIYLANSTNYGLSFNEEVKVNADLGSAFQSQPTVSSGQGVVGIAWEDDRLGERDIYFSASVDYGATFSSDKRVNDDVSGRSQGAKSLWISEGGHTIIAWQDRRNTDRDIYLANSSDQGLTFSQNQRINDDMGSENQYDPSIVMDGNGYVYIAWQDFRNGNDWDIWFARAPAEIADLQPISMAFNPPSPVGEFTTVALNATIMNSGDRDAINVKAQFFHEDPSLGEQIGLNVTIPLIRAGGTAYVEAAWSATPLGFHEIFMIIDPENNVTESNESNNVLSAVIEVVPPPPEILPPENLRTSAVGNDVRLDWEPPIDISNVSHYLIYRAQDQREFDFLTPIYNTSNDPTQTRTNWTDVGAASSGSPTEYYYTVRTVSTDGRRSITSNTAGKWTKAFSLGLNTFSLPLEPFEGQNVSDLAVGIPNVNLIRWMDSNGHWVTHYPAMGPGINDAPARMGEGYEISLSSLVTYTFVGWPASMIRFQEGLGDSVIFRKSLSASIEGNDVNLSWIAPVGADRYLVFRSDKRDGLHDLSLSPIANTTGTYWRDTGIIGNQKSVHYYMVIPLDSATGMGSSTYSVGVTTVVYKGGSDTFALPLRPMENHTLDWYSDAISDVAGMAHMIFELWKYHAKEMPQGVYDVDVLQGEGHQISIDGPSSKFTFVGY